MNEAPTLHARKKWLIFLLLALALGAALRLSFPGDIEYKSDEIYMFTATQKAQGIETWPLFGMTSGVYSMKNPGMSVWVFLALSKISHATTPPELARAVQWLNLGALALLAFFSFSILPGPERIYWLWGTALAAVNPFAVIFQRKIWAQCTLPIFCVLFWIAWHYRHKRLGAFFWGLVGACLGQIHMSGFFLAGGVFLWTAIHDKQVRWVSWVLGSMAGALPFLPWLGYMVSTPHGNGWDWNALWWLLYPKYWFYWLTDPIGIAVTNSLKTRDFFDFLGYPLVGGVKTYLVGIFHLVIVTTGMRILINLKKQGKFFHPAMDSSETTLAVQSVLFSSGILMTLACVEVFRHYLIMTFPLEGVWLSRLALRDSQWGRRHLALLWVSQLFITVFLLVYLHLNHGDPIGNYGLAYQYQK